MVFPFVIQDRRFHSYPADSNILAFSSTFGSSFSFTVEAADCSTHCLLKIGIPAFFDISYIVAQVHFFRTDFNFSIWGFLDIFHFLSFANMTIAVVPIFDLGLA